MQTVTFARQQLEQAAGFLEQMMADVDEVTAHWLPPGVALPIGAHYAHVLIGVDGFVNAMLTNGEPLCAGEWAGRLGLSELPPIAQPDPAAQSGSWAAWARSVRMDLPALRSYAQAVYATADASLATLGDADLGRPIDLSGQGLGEQTVGWVFGAGVAGHIWAHLGEISCLKGLQGQRGYLF